MRVAHASCISADAAWERLGLPALLGVDLATAFENVRNEDHARSERKVREHEGANDHRK